MGDAKTQLDALLAEAGWLQRLALHLTQDPGAARDLTQDTLMTALGDSSFGAVQKPRAWLATVARRLAGRARRGEDAARDAEERFAQGADELAPSATDIAERLELQRLVGAAMLELEEPFRGTLYSIYYRGVRAEEIARQEGVSAGTVRWRAFRARELVREILVRSSGRTWDQTALLLAPLAKRLPTTIDAASSQVAFTMTLKSTAVSAATGILLAIGANAVLPEESAPISPPVPVVNIETSDLEARALRTLEDVQARTIRDLRTAASGLSLPADVRIARGWVRVQEGGGPVSGAFLRFSRGKVVRTASAARDAWAVEGLEPGEWDLTISADGFATEELVVVVPEDAVFERDFTLRRTGSLALRVLDAAGNPLPKTLGSPIQLTNLLSATAVNEEREVVGDWRGRTWRDSLPQIPSDAQGLVVLRAPLPLTLVLRYGTVEVSRKRIVSLADVEDWRVDVQLLSRAERPVQFHTRPAEGKASPGAAQLRAILNGESGDSSRLQLSPDGQPTDLRLPPGAYVLDVQSPGHRHLVKRFRVTDSGADLGELRLEAREER